MSGVKVLKRWKWGAGGSLKKGMKDEWFKGVVEGVKEGGRWRGGGMKNVFALK